ncbi:hypothetical protein PLUTE_a6008 [Pseudoalteromonas luteoviolacea DSM 6061]|nr:hypothetical protein [Pseudoalteromonas luteoviolacea DSM 6061]
MLVVLNSHKQLNTHCRFYPSKFTNVALNIG